MTISVGRVGMIPRESVVISDRARKEMGDLDGLEYSIKESGIISPLAFQDLHNGKFLLLAGERRWKVLDKNEVPEIPARIFDKELSPLEMKIIEKSENFFRKDMEYWEFDKLTLEIHTMQQELHGVKKPGRGSDGWSASDTSEMLGYANKATTTEAIKRAELREKMPDLFTGCKTASDATAVIKKLDEAIVKKSIAEKIEQKTDNKALMQLSNAFILKSFFDGVKEIPSGVFHLVEIDPPYAIDIKKAKMSEGESQYLLEDYNEVESNEYQDFLYNTFKECYRVMEEHSWLLCWFAPEPWFEVVYKMLIEAGFETTRMCPIWTKPSGQNKRPEMHLPNAYEMFFYAWKGRPAIAKPRGSNIFNTPPIPPQQKTHPTERPIELMKDIYETFAFPGSRVLIPFLGSGNGLISAYQLGMTGIGFELGKGYKDSFLVKVHGMK